MENRRAVLLFVAMLCAVSAHAQASPERLITGVHAQQSGHPSVALDQLAPLVTSSSIQPALVQGVSWNVMGSAYQDLGRYREARHAYDTAISVLSAAPGGEDQYAAALDNLGSLEAAVGHALESKALRVKAREEYVSAGDHAGIARTSNNLAVLALSGSDIRQASVESARSFQEERLTKDLDADDRATLLSVRGTVSMAEGDTSSARTDENEAIELWSASYGPSFPKLSNGYLLLAQIEERSGNNADGLTAINQALTLEARNSKGQLTPSYVRAQLSEARLLIASGRGEEGREIARQAQAAMSSLSHSRDEAEIISVASLK